MEQRIGSTSQPLEGAGFDPAFIPGLTSPTSGEDARPEKDADADADAAAEPEESEEPQPAASEDSGESEDSDESGDPGDPGPVFEVADFRARLVADQDGVRLRLDDQECEFRWDEIAAVETESPRFGKRFTVTVHTPDRRWYPIEIVAKSRSQHQDWDERLDEVLDAYFEDGEEGGEGPDRP